MGKPHYITFTVNNQKLGMVKHDEACNFEPDVDCIYLGIQKRNRGTHEE